MSILVTGVPGAGKSTLVKYAHKLHDSHFIDADEIPALCEWREFATGRPIGLVEALEFKSDDTWHQKYGWYWRLNYLKEFIDHNSTAIICGSAENVTDSFSLFDQIVILKKTETQLVANLTSPERQNPFGRSTQQRADFMEWQEQLIAEVQTFNHVIVEGNNMSDSYQEIVSLGQ